MKVLKPVTILFALLVNLTIFSQTNAVLNYLPANAKMILKINPASLGQKMKWEDLVKYKMFEDFLKEVPEEGKDFIKNPSQTGIDLSQGLFVVVPAGANKQAKPVVYGIPKDTALFAAMIKKVNPQKKITKIGNGKLLIDKNTAIAWNNEIFIITGVSPKEGPPNQTAKAKAAAELAKTKQLTEKGKSLLNKKTPMSNENFISLLQEHGDMYLWLNNTTESQSSKKGKAQEFAGMLNKNFMRMGSFSAGVINFENGKVVAQMKRYVSNTADSIYKKYPLKNLNTDLLRKLPSGRPIFLASFNFSPGMLGEIFSRAGFDKYIDSTSKKKVKIDDILSSIKGDITLAGMKVYEFTEEDSVTQALGGMQVFLAGRINDKEKIKSIVASMEKENQDTTAGKPGPKMKPLILSDDSIFVVSISQIAAKKFLETQGKNDEIEKIIAPYKDHPNAFFLDLKTIFGLAMQTFGKGRSEEDAKQASEVLGMFDHLISYGGEYNNKSVSSTIELTLTNKDENSLKQFMNLINLFYSMKPKPSTAINDRPFDK